MGKKHTQSPESVEGRSSKPSTTPVQAGIDDSIVLGAPTVQEVAGRPDRQCRQKQLFLRNSEELVIGTRGVFLGVLSITISEKKVNKFIVTRT